MEEIEDILENSDTPVINVLDRDAFERARVPGTRNIPVDGPEFLDEVEAIAPERDAPVVVYCAGEECAASGRAVEVLEDAGYTDVSAYEGGMEEWIAAGRDVESDEPNLAR